MYNEVKEHLNRISEHPKQSPARRRRRRRRRKVRARADTFFLLRVALYRMGEGGFVQGMIETPHACMWGVAACPWCVVMSACGEEGRVTSATGVGSFQQHHGESQHAHPRPHA